MYLCEICNYLTSTNHSLKIHCKTKKHIALLKLSNTIQQPNKLFNCSICNKEYTHQSSFSRHKKSCNETLQKLNEIINLQKYYETNESKIIKMLEEKNKLLEEKNKLLEDLYVKKQKRKSFPEKNVIYIVTTEENKKNRIYIIGKAKELKNRLSTYNKTSEHEVVYYKGCDEDDLKVIEQNVLRKLRNYREKANRDRFVLPIEKEISFFTEIIDQCINDIKDC
jgi:hypothetical protein